MIEIKGKTVKTEVNEMSLGEFQKCLEIFGNENLETFEKYLDVLQVLGLLEEDANALSLDDLTVFVGSFCKEGIPVTKIPTHVEFGGVTYKIWSGEGEFSIPLKAMIEIERDIKKTGIIDFVKVSAILCKPEGEVDTPSLRIYRESIFSKAPVSLFLSLVVFAATRLGEKLAILNKASLV